MPWKETTSMSLREEFAALAKGQGVSLSELAKRFGISRKTAYKWLHRDAAVEPLVDRSRRPHHTTTRTTDAFEQTVVALRRQHPQWGGRKLHRVLLNAGHTDVRPPARSRTSCAATDGCPMRRRPRQGPWKRFEHALPNDLWQMDFEGTIAIGEG